MPKHGLYIFTFVYLHLLPQWKVHTYMSTSWACCVLPLTMHHMLRITCPTSASHFYSCWPLYIHPLGRHTIEHFKLWNSAETFVFRHLSIRFYKFCLVACPVECSFHLLQHPKGLYKWTQSELSYVPSSSVTCCLWIMKACLCSKKKNTRTSFYRKTLSLESILFVFSKLYCWD